ncbi:MAG: hypothetical protein QOH70_2478 [Blastocatellia bacterium]|jgi:hypothetical protein|nr:hypothetical protein [Blastocatellia bacterium]
MRRRNLSESLKKKLRDPAWQFVGVVIMTLALIGPIVLSSLKSSSQNELEANRLVIYLDAHNVLTDFLEPVGTRTRVLVDGKEEQDLKEFVYLLEYRGDHALRPSDFGLPLHARIPTSRKIIAVQKSSNLEGPLRFSPESNHYEHTKQPPVAFEAQVLTEHDFEIKPILMNPGDWFRVEIYTSSSLGNDKSGASPETRKSKEEQSTSDILYGDVTWSCHLAGVRCPAERTIEGNVLGFGNPWFLQVYVYHIGWSVYFITAFTILNLILLIALAKSAGIQKATKPVQIFLFALAVVLSMASSEMVSFWLGLDSPFDFENLAETIIFGLDVAIVFTLSVFIFLKRVNRRKKGAPQTTSSPTGAE